MKSLSELCQPTELSCQILNDLAVKWAKNGPPHFWRLEDTHLDPPKPFELYGEEPKICVWSKLSAHYKWEECI